MQSIKECVVIKEKVKKYIVERNAREGVAGSGSSDTEAPLTTAMTTRVHLETTLL